MEQHPVPQNVTTFQFRLIGDMTIKQFGYLAGGAILAYVSFKLPLPFFFTWPLTIIFAVGGVGFAFVPIEDRPMDIWVLSFLKNVYSPTLFVWEKSQITQQRPPVQNMPPQRPPQPMQQRPVVTSPVAPRVQPPSAFVPQTQNIQPTRSTASIIGGMYSKNMPNAAMQQPTIPMNFQTVPGRQVASNKGMFDWFFDLFAPKKTYAPVAAQATPQMAAHMPTPTVVGSHLDLSTPPVVTRVVKAQERIDEVKKNEEVLQEKLTELKHEIENKTASQADARILELQKQLTEVLAQKDKMEAEVLSLRNQSQATKQQIPLPAAQAIPQAPGQTQQAQKQPTVKIITPEGAVRAGLPRLTTFPNVVTGITKDSDNNLLPGVLVTVKDTIGVPVRALKTNRLGQFAASTPLSNGVYFVEIEDPRFRYTFDRVQITLNGSIVPALEIIAKSQKQLNRDMLAKEIFGKTT